MYCFDYKDRVHFGVHKMPVQEKDIKLSAYLYRIVIKSPDGIVVSNGFCGLEQYAYPYNGHYIVHGINIAPAKYKLLSICKCLNYLLHHEKIKRLYDVTPAMLYRCFEIYRTSEITPGSGRYVNQTTLDKFVSINCAFFANLSMDNPGMQFAPTDLLNAVTVYNKKNMQGKGTVIYVPIYKKKSQQSKRIELIRDLPEAAIIILLEEVWKHDPMIYFAVILQVYAGLRASECMNIRRHDSPLSNTPGIDFRYIGTAVSQIYLDLTREYHMRSDGVDVGKIKRDTNAMTSVYPPNIPKVLEAYAKHNKVLSGVPYEKDFAPMFVSAGGKAMTTDTYQRRFNAIVKNYLRPRLLREEDPQLVAFGQALLTHNFPSHGLRHYYTAKLAIDGLSAEQIMAYRGDRNIDSAVAYLHHKGILEEQLRKSHTIALKGLTSKGNYIP